MNVMPFGELHISIPNENFLVIELHSFACAILSVPNRFIILRWHVVAHGISAAGFIHCIIVGYRKRLWIGPY